MTDFAPDVDPNVNQEFDQNEQPHRRRNPLSGDWVLVSPHRAKRPWQGLEEPPARERLPEHDAGCYLCPGNRRIQGANNPDYRGPWVFDNDFPALKPDGAALKPDGAAQQSQDTAQDPLFASDSVRGLSRVICYSESHSATLATLGQQKVAALIDTWCREYQRLGQEYLWVQVFENKGAINGCSNPHPHGQIWASDRLPTLVAREDQQQRHYTDEHGSKLLLDYAEREWQAQQRLVCHNQDWLALVPYWACWPFETLVLPRFAVQRMPELTGDQRSSLAALLSELSVRYDNLFQTPFPYSMGWHGAPFDGEHQGHWQLHCHFYPPLLRSASVRKFMVGYEMLAESQRDLTPEQAAALLRQQPTQHYLLKEPTFGDRS
ncbi:UDP-glucose--hexose-1-phosphate uridylyltransferase [Shewanella cyperi]|uniref:Galactose-1-phosphate uridylyltransferase n=1 Tax=Shewanella cyperi TaxID=2814292 RepID=A0A974XLQ8_9GAMM|nr:UDP-glucose--hexose-1-phosphate uridylyltransferase [Shewanella cyperi]QSX30629.1 UDP-glucose--hexose-1-phosphate uridylyltransferase [Shewanella cyperi]